MHSSNCYRGKSGATNRVFRRPILGNPSCRLKADASRDLKFGKGVAGSRCGSSEMPSKLRICVLSPYSNHSKDPAPCFSQTIYHVCRQCGVFKSWLRLASPDIATGMLQTREQGSSWTHNRLCLCSELITGPRG